jgi:serine-type D-Ala-D-Ala carboxypeptidase (penicillin-binding protein 5/6)
MNKLKKIIGISILTFIIFSTFTFNIKAAAPIPSVSADGAVLMDAATGQILYSKNPDVAYPPASTTKTMTMLLTLENCKLDDVVVVGKKPPLADGSKIYLYEGEHIKVKDLLYAVSLVSANDCAEALAEHISGSIENFAVLMNKRAKELGCTETNFVNPTGLYDSNHKTSAHDLALILRELAKHSEFTQIASTSSYMIAATDKSSKARPLWNENKLVQKGSRLYYPGCDGGKTGYTIQSKHSYTATAERNGQRLVVALIHDNYGRTNEDATALLNYGFNNFELRKLYSKGDVVDTLELGNVKVPLEASEDFYYVADKGTTVKPEFTINKTNISKKYFKAGDLVLNTDVTLNNKKIGTLKLASGIDFGEKNILESTPFADTLLQNQYVIPAVLILLMILTVLLKNKKHKKVYKRK